MNYKALVIGAGHIGASFDCKDDQFILTHAHAYTKHPSFQLVAVVDPNSHVLEKATQTWDVQGFTNLQEAIKTTNPDVVSICSPDETHGEILLSLSLFPLKGVICEKPLILSSGDLDLLNENLRRHPMPIIVNFIRRFVPEFQTLKSLIKAKGLGRFLSGQGNYSKGIIHNGSHLIDLVFYLFDECKIDIEVSREEVGKADPACDFLLKLNDKTINVHSLEEANYTIFEIDLFFENGRVRVIDSGRKIEISYPKKSEVYKGYRYLECEEKIFSDIDKGLYYCIDHLNSCLERESLNLSPVSNAVQVSRVINNALR